MSAAPPSPASEPDPASTSSRPDQENATAAAPPLSAGAGFAPDATSAAAAEPAPADRAGASRPRKGPLSFLSGALTSGLLAWLSLGLSQKVVAYYALHPPHYTAQIAQSIATALKTLIVGMCFLATFSFAFIGLGLLLTFLRSLLPGWQPEEAS